MRVPRTFVFVDISGFTAFTADNGDDAAGRVLAGFRATLREVASERGVRIAKWLGDGCMLVAVDQGDALTAALDLERAVSGVIAPLAARVGAASGLALLFEGDDYIGQAVNLAARLCDVAEPNQVLVASAGLVDLPPGLEARPLTPLRLPGFPDPVPVVELGGSPAPRASEADELWTRAPFAS